MVALNGSGQAKRLYSKVVKLIMLLQLLPMTSATAERSFTHYVDWRPTCMLQWDRSIWAWRYCTFTV